LEEKAQLGARNDAREPPRRPNADSRDPERVAQRRDREAGEVEQRTERGDMAPHARLAETPFFEEVPDVRIQAVGIARLQESVGACKFREMP
jgi:hypothetical protein